MKKIRVLHLILCAVMTLTGNLYAQVGYYDAPYVRYEANVGTLANGATILGKSFNQADLQSEASEQICVNFNSNNASVSWPVTTAGNGLVVRYSVPDVANNTINTVIGTVDVYSGTTFMGTLNLKSYWSWEDLINDPNPSSGSQAGVSNPRPKMRFDEVRMKLSSPISIGETLKLVRTSGNVTIDFAELELIPPAVTAASGEVTYSGAGSGLQAFINSNGGQTIFLAPGTYDVNTALQLNNPNTTLKGAGMWYTQINFTSGGSNAGGLWARNRNIKFNGLYLTTVSRARSNNAKAINGNFIDGGSVTNVWAEHFECGAWIAVYDGATPGYTDGLKISYCRFRNNYADGVNFCKGTLNSIVEHCSFRNNGDDDMAVWSAGSECRNNTFRYNTSENCWRASGVAIYGGYNNKAYNILIQDNLEVGIKVNNEFPDSPFSNDGMHEFYNIIIKRCGTFNDLFRDPVGAIDLKVSNNNNHSGTDVKNVKFSCIDIIDSKNDAIYMRKAGGDNFNNIVFENIRIDGTGKEYPNNNLRNVFPNRGYGFLVSNGPGGYGTQCNITYNNDNRGGNAPSNYDLGSYNLSAGGSCPGGCSLGSTTTIAPFATTIGICNTGVALTATSTASSGDVISNIEFFANGVSIGVDYTSPYQVIWTPTVAGNYQITAVSHYGPSGTTSTSQIQTAYVADAIYQTSPAPNVTDGTIQASWNSYAAKNLEQGFNSPPNLAAFFRTRYDANNLYILVDVTDDDLNNNSANDWEDDGVEIFIDMGNNKSTTFPNNSTYYQYGFLYGTTAPNAPAVNEYKHTPAATGGVQFEQVLKSGGYIMEIKIPWATLGSAGAPVPGSFVGFEVKIDDDDDTNGAGRDYELAWTDGTFNCYQNPSLAGTLQMANCDNPLPVEMLSFTGEKINGTVLLNWATATETKNKEFIIERSPDASDWEPIGTVAGNGNSNTVVNYSFTDYEPQDGLGYYRLRQTDIDGKFAYSAVVVVQAIEGKHVLSIAPNPFENVLTIRSTVKGEMDIKIYDLAGQLMYAHKLENNANAVNIQPELPFGTYIITIQTDTSIEQQKIIKR